MRSFAAGLATVGALSACSQQEVEPAVATDAAPLFNNGGFETGKLDPYWLVALYANPTGVLYPDDNSPPASFEALGLTSCATAMTQLNPPDCVGNLTRIRTGSPPESQQMTGLEMLNLVSPRWPKFGKSSAVVNEQGYNFNANGLKQRYTTTAADVDHSDGKIHIRFAMSPQLQNPVSHSRENQPYFFIVIRNITQGTSLYQTFSYANEPGIPWHQFDPGGVDQLILWTDWQVFDVAPGNYALWIGDTIEIEVIASGCALGGHWGQVFVDGFGSFLPSVSIAGSAVKLVQANADLVYTFSVENTTSAVARNVVATEVIPNHTSFRSISPPPGVTCTTPAVGAIGTGLTGGPAVVCNLGSMNPFSTQTFQVTVRTDSSPPPTLISNGNYFVSASGLAPIVGPKIQTRIGYGPYTDLSVTVSDGVAAVLWGSPVTYTIIAENFGPTGVTGATVTDTFPAQLASVTWSCAGQNGGVCGTPAGSGNLTPANGAVNLPVGGRAVFTVTANVVSGSGAGRIVNSTQIASPPGILDNNDANDADTDLDSLTDTLRWLTVSKDLAETGRGVVVSSPAAISCADACGSQAAQFPDGSYVTLTAVARAGDTFTGWTGACTDSGNICTVPVIGGDATVTAHFRGPLVTGSAPTGHGAVTCTPSPVVLQASSTCTIAPDAGYQLFALTDNAVDVISSVSAGQYALSNVVIDHDVVANFLCDSDAQCGSGLCVDGVCCNAVCPGQCEACDVPGHVGVCSPVAGPPHGNRPPGWCVDGTWTLAGGGCSSGGASLAPLALLALALLLLRRRARRLVGPLALLLIAPTAARAQAETVDAQRFDSIGGAHDILTVPSARLAVDMETHLEVLTDYASQPLRYVREGGGGSVDLVRSMTTASFAAGIGIEDWTEFSLVLPVEIGGTGEPITGVDPRLPSSVPMNGAGDLRLTPKVALTSQERPVLVAIVAPMTFPTGNTPYLSSHAFVVSPRVTTEFGSLREWRVLADAGVTLRKKTAYAGTELGSAIAYGVGGELAFARGKMSALATLTGEFGKPQDRPLELLAALRYHTSSGVGFTLGGGPGLSDSIGTPRYRVFAGVAYTDSKRERGVDATKAVGSQPKMAWPGKEPARPPEVTVIVSPEPSSAPAPAASPAASPAATAAARPAATTAATPATSATAAVAAPAPTRRTAVAESKAVLRGDRIALLEPIKFVPGGDDIAQASFGLLADVVFLLRAHPEIPMVRIEVHTDDDGTPAQLLEASRRRAGKIRDLLVKAGVEARRLEARGYGDTRPITTNYSDRDRAINRRVELVVVKGAPAAPAPAPQ
jgi:uncharacterized repeat protein (TIGR01451 family)/uncharacterized repeat protein (TIGR02543 family)/uncharacterized protein (TIGR03382 family)